MNKALFLDLDHTLITPLKGRRFPKDIYDWKFKKNILDSIEPYVEAGYKIIIISNQGGIEAGHLTTKEFEKKMSYILPDLIKYFNYTEFYYYYCPSNNSKNYFRKPNPGMILKAAVDHEINLRKSLFVGDASGVKGSYSSSDRDAAENAGVEYVDINEFIEDYQFNTMILRA